MPESSIKRNVTPKKDQFGPFSFCTVALLKLRLLTLPNPTTTDPPRIWLCPPALNIVTSYSMYLWKNCFSAY